MSMRLNKTADIIDIAKSSVAHRAACRKNQVNLAISEPFSMKLVGMKGYIKYAPNRIVTVLHSINALEVQKYHEASARQVTAISLYGCMLNFSRESKKNPAKARDKPEILQMIMSANEGPCV